MPTQRNCPVTGYPMIKVHADYLSGHRVTIAIAVWPLAWSPDPELPYIIHLPTGLATHQVGPVFDPEAAVAAMLRLRSLTDWASIRQGQVTPELKTAIREIGYWLRGAYAYGEPE